jgi:hypothetical protein
MRYRFQPPLLSEYGRRIARESAYSAMPPEMKDWIRSQQKRFKCSASWVVVTAVSIVSDIPVVPCGKLQGRKNGKER